MFSLSGEINLFFDTLRTFWNIPIIRNRFIGNLIWECIRYDDSIQRDTNFLCVVCVNQWMNECVSELVSECEIERRRKRQIVRLCVCLWFSAVTLKGRLRLAHLSRLCGLYKPILNVKNTSVFHSYASISINAIKNVPYLVKIIKRFMLNIGPKNRQYQYWIE